MKRPMKWWLALILLPIPLWFSIYFIGLFGLAGYWSYYRPLWFIGEPFFKYSTDTGWYYPSWIGIISTAIIYSLVYWLGIYSFRKVKVLLFKH